MTRLRSLRLPLLSVAALLAGCAPAAPDRPAEPAAATPAPAPTSAAATPCRIVVLGIDGATWRAIDPLVARGDMPSFAALRASGATGDLASLPPYNSPQMWTSIATGQPPSVHGIESFTMTGAGGKPVPSSSNLRRSPAVWNVLSQQGRKVGVVGWYVTWPAERVEGIVVSDHVRPLEESAIFWPVTAEQEAALQRRTYPEELLARIEPLFVDVDEVDREEMREDLKLFGVKHPYLQDETAVRVALDLRARDAYDLFLLYQHGTDVMQHLSYGPFEEHIRGRAEATRASSRVVDYYRYQDDNVRRIVEAMGGRIDGLQVVLPAGWQLVIVSDHGFGPGTRPNQPALTGDHLPEGILVLAGDAVKPGAAVTGATVLDVLPTLLHLLELPLSKELPGKVLASALTEPHASRADRTVDRYPFTPEGGSAIPSPIDGQIVDELRSLGYIP